MSLIDDGLVDKEKIGNSNYFWSFPAKKDRIMQLQHQQNLADVEQLKTASEEASARLADAKRGREDGNDRPAKLLRLTTALQERAALEAEYETLKENDPAALDLLEKELTMTTHAAKRWTDNILECKCYLKKKMAYNEKDACKAIQIPISFDCTFNHAIIALSLLERVYCFHHPCPFFVSDTQTHSFFLLSFLARRPGGQDPQVKQERARDRRRTRLVGSAKVRIECPLEGRLTFARAVYAAFVFGVGRDIMPFLARGVRVSLD